MNSTLRLTWLIFGMSLLFAIAGAFLLVAIFVASLVAVPGLMDSFAHSISSAQPQDMDAIKEACLMLAKVEERDQVARMQFTWWGYWLVLLFGTVCAVLSGRLLYVMHRTQDAAITESTEPTQSMVRTILSRAWQGQLRLWQAFWFLYLPVPLALASGVSAFYVALASSYTVRRSFLLQFVAYPLLWALSYVSFIALSIVVWRCSVNTNRRIWTYAARGMVIVSAVGPVIELLVYLSRLFPRS
ncbi:MAG: hypothetical protein ACM31P_18855 [Actinomycetota bacterium]